MCTGDACTGTGEWEERQSQVLRLVITEFGLSLRGVKDAARRASKIRLQVSSPSPLP